MVQEREGGLHAASIIEELKRCGVTYVIGLPGSELAFLHQALQAEPSIRYLSVCREGESMAIATGLWVGGERAVVLIQSTGFFESGDSIRGLCLDGGVPLVLIIGYRGYTRHGPTADSAARYIEPILHTWGITYYLVEADRDAGRLSVAFEEAQRTSRPVALLIGKE